MLCCGTHLPALVAMLALADCWARLSRCFMRQSVWLKLNPIELLISCRVSWKPCSAVVWTVDHAAHSQYTFCTHIVYSLHFLYTECTQYVILCTHNVHSCTQVVYSLCTSCTQTVLGYYLLVDLAQVSWERCLIGHVPSQPVHRCRCRCTEKPQSRPHQALHHSDIKTSAIVMSDT